VSVASYKKQKVKNCDLDLLISSSADGEALPWSILCLLTLVWIVQAVFLLECGLTDKPTCRVTDIIDHHTRTAATAGVGSKLTMNKFRKVDVGRLLLCCAC